MKKALISALILVSLLLAAAVGVLVYLQTGDDEKNGGNTPATSQTNPQETQQESSQEQQEPEETVGISLPTEDPSEMGPAYTWPENEEGTGETAAPADPEATDDADNIETPPREL